jgi:hypothetical protein
MHPMVATPPLRLQIASFANLLPLPGVRFDPEQTCMVVGSARSGTTWLGQALAGATDRCLLTEPFMPTAARISAAGFTWRTHRAVGEPWPDGRRVIEGVASGRGVAVKLLRRNGASTWTRPGLIIKSVRLTRLLPWVVRNVHLGGIVYLHRHPCAVVASQLARHRPGSAARFHQDNVGYLRARLPHLLPLAREVPTDLEKRALTWALDQHAPLSDPDPRWERVSYERLVTRGVGALEELAANLGLRAKLTPEELRRSSWQAREWSVDHATASTAERLGAWRRRLTDAEVDRVLEIVHACGVRGFTRAPYYDPDRVAVSTG